MSIGKRKENLLPDTIIWWNMRCKQICLILPTLFAVYETSVIRSLLCDSLNFPLAGPVAAFSLMFYFIVYRPDPPFPFDCRTPFPRVSA